MKIGIQAGLAILSLFVAYLIWNSIDSKMVLTESVEARNEVVHKKLEQIRDAQVEYKKVRGQYAGTFNDLIDFLENDSIVQVFMKGDLPDSLIGREAEALEMEIIIRDTTKLPVREYLFKENFQSIVDSMVYVPFADGEKFVINAGTIEKNKMQAVPVFAVTAYLKHIYLGLNTDNEGYDMNDSLMIGSMEEVSINGNWD